MQRFLLPLSSLAGACLLAAAGAASAQPAADPRDPWEGYNRTMHAFNDSVDTMFLKPVAQLYDAVTPAPVDQGISNFFSNLGELRNFLNCMLQGKPGAGGDALARFAINSTVGLAGFIDVAAQVGIHKTEEDFGQTLGAAGTEPGPYFVIPFLGPSTVRDAVAKPLDFAANPLTWAGGDTPAIGYSINAMDTRSDLLRTEKAVEDITEDEYALIRDAYLDQRAYDVSDGMADEPYEIDE